MDDVGELREALRGAWSAQTSDDAARWTPANPAAGQCGVTARVERDAWNRLPDGRELDLTREQFGPDVALDPGSPGEPLAAVLHADRAALLRSLRGGSA